MLLGETLATLSSVLIGLNWIIFKLYQKVSIILLFLLSIFVRFSD